MKLQTFSGSKNLEKSIKKNIFKNKLETVVVTAECYSEEGYKSYLKDMQENKDKGRKLLEIK